MIERTDINNVLSQIRSMQQRMNQPVENNMNQIQQPLQNNIINHQLDGVRTAIAVDNVDVKNTPSFGTMFKSAVDNVNATQKHSADLSTRFEQGDPSLDLPQVMIALEKSTVSFQAMTQVRNKLISAYQDIMNMPI